MKISIYQRAVFYTPKAYGSLNMRTGLECCGPNVHGDLDDSDREQNQDETAIAHKLADEWAIAPNIPDSMR